MREIKFDAIYKPTGEHFIPNTLDFRQKIVTGDFDGEVNDWCHFSTDGNYGDVILRQFTGIKDKNDKEIFEGDIVQFTVNRFGSDGIEKAIKNGAVYYNDEMTLSVDGWVLARIKSREVIGNIYENPELLEVTA